jgi:signal transduction histidine kinase
LHSTYTSPKGEHSFVSISEEDNGQGIAEAHQANIFNMFYRANDRTQGFGLALHILKGGRATEWHD